ncbi:transcriptional regulator [Roseibium aquae]|uniref:Transcriptional regulator n=1 Tax=Roseibium aquae TaxID=1323746 RepID=A0A916TD16_9HYPH|nr:sulfurtransferase TusA family protein [Roseibium aquae]GGB38969.1 transcriptional regulator [Roseibium aquae]
MTDTILDLKGLKCPLPVLKTRKAMKTLAPGARITVLTTDPMASIDIPHFCNEAGHTLVEANREGDNGRFVIEKAAS